MNEDDLVTYLPLSKWGFDRYGITYSASIKEHYEDTDDLFEDDKYTWEYMFDKEWKFTDISTYIDDYNYNRNLKNTIKAMENIADCREDLYVFTGEFYTTVSYHGKSVDECKKKLGNRITRFCNLRFDTTLINETKVEQTPAAFMMILADLTATFEHDSEKGNYYQTYDSKALFIGFKVALRYDLAKAKFCLSGCDEKFNNVLSLGGMGHGHMVGTYYFLANDYKNKLEEKQ